MSLSRVSAHVYWPSVARHSIQTSRGSSAYTGLVGFDVLPLTAGTYFVISALCVCVDIVLHSHDLSSQTQWQTAKAVEQTATEQNQWIERNKR